MGIKYPVLLMRQGDAFTITYWSGGDDNKLLWFDYLPENYPSFEAGEWESIDEMLKRTAEMEEEGWEVEDDRRDEVHDGAWS